MAGIGFELEKAVREDSYLSSVRGYLYAGVISSGPWLVSVVALSFLGVFSAAFLTFEEAGLFAATVTHTFAVSLITTGLLQMVVTRYLADELYWERTDSVAPTFVAVLVLSSGVQFVVINLLLSTTDLPLAYRLPAASLYVAICGTWVCMIFLSAARDYLSIAVAFTAGYAISFAAAIYLGSRYGLSAYLVGFAAGQVIALGLLASRVFAEFELERSFDTGFAGHFKLYPDLAAIGFVYNLALWVDKFVFWLSPRGVNTDSFLNVFPIYDTTFFVSSLAMVPALALFTVNLETDFYRGYKQFYAGIQNRASLQELLDSKAVMGRSLKLGLLTLFKVQAVVALLATTVIAPFAVRVYNLPGYAGLFRVMVIAMSVQAFLMFAVLVLLYLDMRGSALIVVSVFMLTNLGFTTLSVPWGVEFYGYGFLASSVVSVAVSLALLHNRFRKLEYLTFVRQPLM